MRRMTIAVLAAAAVAGCGGDEGTDAPSQAGAAKATATAMPGGDHATFVADADAICAKANEKEVGLGAEGPGWIYGDQFTDADFLEEFNDAGRVALHELKQLSPPWRRSSRVRVRAARAPGRPPRGPRRRAAGDACPR
jgi:hypothetical protein